MGGKLTTVEAARGIAALGVVFFHANASMAHMHQRTLGFLSFGESGVDFFFVLSGFIIAYVHWNDVGKPRKAGQYFAKRFIRLFPLLWIVVGGWLGVRLLLGPSVGPTGTSLLLYPSLEKPMPVIVWTLRHELFFYCAFATLLIDRKFGEGFFAAWLGMCLAQLVLSVLGNPVRGLPSFFLSSYNLDFMAGIAIARMHRRAEFEPSAGMLLAGCITVPLVLLLRSLLGGGRSGTLDYVSLGATLWTLILGGAFALLLHGVLRWEGRIAVPKPLLMLGASSYALYLVHTPLNAFSQHIAALLPVGMSHLLIVAVSVVAGWVLHTKLERPLSAFLRKRLASSETHAAFPRLDLGGPVPAIEPLTLPAPLRLPPHAAAAASDARAPLRRGRSSSSER